jgi:hypothetical protein
LDRAQRFGHELQGETQMDAKALAEIAEINLIYAKSELSRLCDPGAFARAQLNTLMRR